MIFIVNACQKEIDKFPDSIKEDLVDALARLEEMQQLSFPLSRPMPIIGRSVYELRLRDATGIYRIIYMLISNSGIYLLVGFKKKTQKTPKQIIDLAKKRLRDLNL